MNFMEVEVVYRIGTVQGFLYTCVRRPWPLCAPCRVLCQSLGQGLDKGIYSWCLLVFWKYATPHLMCMLHV